jgi:hypothetical protein
MDKNNKVIGAFELPRGIDSIKKTKTKIKIALLVYIGILITVNLIFTMICCGYI